MQHLVEHKMEEYLSKIWERVLKILATRVLWVPKGTSHYSTKANQVEVLFNNILNIRKLSKGTVEIMKIS